MVKNQSKKSSSENKADILLDNISIYLFVLGVLTMVWMLTGFGYFWPIWFLVGWLVGPQSLPFFRNLFGTVKFYSNLLLEKAQQNTKASKPSKDQKPKEKKSSSDDSDNQGA